MCHHLVSCPSQSPFFSVFPSTPSGGLSPPYLISPSVCVSVTTTEVNSRMIVSHPGSIKLLKDLHTSIDASLIHSLLTEGNVNTSSFCWKLFGDPPDFSRPFKIWQHNRAIENLGPGVRWCGFKSGFTTS